MHSSRVISALPAFQLAELVESAHPSLSKMLKTIDCVTVGLVNIEWSGKQLNQEAFGFLVPSSQKLPILGVVYDTCSFPQGDRTIVTVMMGGKWFESLFGKDPKEDTLLKTALQQIESVLGIKEAPCRSQVHILRKW